MIILCLNHNIHTVSIRGQKRVINITGFGNFTANSKEIPPPLPPEYWPTLLKLFDLSTILGAMLIPAIINWTKTKSTVKKLNYYHKQLVLYMMTAI